MPKNLAVYCPRCDRGFLSTEGSSASMAMMVDHVKKAHPDYYEAFLKD